MNDRYLYKGKIKGNLTGHEELDWVIGNLIVEQSTGRHFIIDLSHFDENIKLCDVIIEVDQSTICQCTGLKDKNGKMIWENDIVRFQFDNDDCPFPNKDTKKRIGKIFFSGFRASWSIAMGKAGSDRINNDLFRYVQNGNRVEVIGNIFDNPELLEVGE